MDKSDIIYSICERKTIVPDKSIIVYNKITYISKHEKKTF